MKDITGHIICSDEQNRLTKRVEDIPGMAGGATGDNEISLQNMSKSSDADSERIHKKEQSLAKRSMIALIAVIGCISAMYLGGASYYTDKFYHNTYINGIDFTGQTIEDVVTVFNHYVAEYNITISGRDGLEIVIWASQIDYQYVNDGSVARLKSAQGSYNWLQGYLGMEDYELPLQISFNSDTYKEVLASLECFDETNIKAPQDAYVTFSEEENKYIIADAEIGNQIEGAVLDEHLQEALMQGKSSISLEEIGAYKEPALTAESQSLIDLAASLNQYVMSSITYNFGEVTEVVDGKVIKDWLSYDENNVVTLHQDNVAAYLADLAAQYDTYGSPRSLVTHDGSVVEVSGGWYGWQINQEEEAVRLMDDIANCVISQREPSYNRTAVSRLNSDLGETYVEIDMSNQQLWFYKDGVEILSSDIVTGNLSTGHGTPSGTFLLKAMTRNTVLRGEDYASPVSYWMPFNGGIGLHDANWRWKFGGEVYRYSGSHGCINMPTENAKILYENIEVGVPIICYYR